MSTDLEKIKQTLVNISSGDNILDTLIEFERTLDNAEIFAYKNWILGELVEGPEISRYWYKTTWMYPYGLMPDPDAGLRLTKLGAKVNFRKGIFKKPVKVRGPQDWRDPETKQAKMAEYEIWLVTIELPIKYIDKGIENYSDIIQKEIEKTNSDIESAFEETADDLGDIDNDEMDMGSEELGDIDNEPNAEGDLK